MQSVNAAARIDAQIGLRPVEFAAHAHAHRLGIVGVREGPSCSSTLPAGMALLPPLSPMVAAA